MSIQMELTQQSVFFILVGFGIWMGILSIFTLQMIVHYNKLTGGKHTIGLKDILDGMIGRENLLRGRVAQTEQDIRAIQSDIVFHVQRIGIVRFNPFADTGGAQSFTMALLDRANNGVVMTSLYGRTGNRWYVKEVSGGKGKVLALSAEEQAAIKQAAGEKKHIHE